MARKNILDSYVVFAGASLATNQTSQSTKVAFTDNLGYLIDWAGASPVGQIVIEGCADNLQNAPNGLWHPLQFSSAISITGNSGQHDVTINQFPYSWIRVRYVATSGTGALTMTLTTKQIGG